MQAIRRTGGFPGGAPQMRVLRILAGAVLLNLMTGSLYAWSLFIAPAQEALDVGRAAVSSIFAVATVAFAATMFLAPVLVRPGTALKPALATTALAAGGLLLSGMAESLWGVILGYGVLFGFASGIAYSAALQSAVGALESRRGLATGIAVSSYALGAVVFAPLFRIGPERWGVWDTFLVIAAIFAAMGIVSALLIAPAQIPRPDDQKGGAAVSGPFWRLWLCFFCGCTAGLMALGHAAAIVNAYDLVAPAAALGTGLITAANGAGRLASGFATDYLRPRTVLLLAKVLAAGRARRSRHLRLGAAGLYRARTDRLRLWQHGERLSGGDGAVLRPGKPGPGLWPAVQRLGRRRADRAADRRRPVRLDGNLHRGPRRRGRGGSPGAGLPVDDPAAARDRRGGRVDEGEGNREGCKRTMARGRKGREMVDRKFSLAAFCAGLVLLCAVAAQADYKAGQRAWEDGRHARAVAQWKVAAKANDARAMLALGLAYAKGLGVPQDYVEAHKWFDLAAARGSARAAPERDALAIEMTARERAEARKLAQAWRPGKKRAAAVKAAKRKPAAKKTAKTQTRGGKEIGKNKTGGAESSETETRRRQAGPEDGRAEASRPAVAGREGVPGLRLLPADDRRPGWPLHNGRRVRGAAPSRDHCAALRGEQI